MEMKHVIIFAVIGFAALLGFNIINGNSHERNREMAISSTISEQSPATAEASDTSIANKPLGEQPKAILDDATSKIDQAQQAEQDRLDQMSSAQ